MTDVRHLTEDDAQQFLEDGLAAPERSRAEKHLAGCPSCQAPIRAIHNIPVLSYLALGRRCASCRAPISKRYPLVELATAAAFAIVAVDPDSMKAQTILEHRGAPMGAATVAQQVGDHLYLGSFVGDRIVRAPLPAPAR